MPHFSRADLITTLGMILRSIERDSELEFNRSAGHTMFEVILEHWHLVDLKTDRKLIQVCRDKANEGGARFKKYVDTFEELLNPPPPPLRRSARLRARREL